MGGANCAVKGCTASSSKCRGLSFFQIKHLRHPWWEEALVQAINRTDEKLNRNNAKICSRHFTPDCIRISEKGYCFLVTGSLPTLFMPHSFIETPIPKCISKKLERKNADSTNAESYSYDDIRLTATQLPDSWFLISSSDSQVEVGQLKDGAVLHFKVQVQCNLTTTVSVLGLPAKRLTTNLNNLSLLSFLTKLSSWHVCPGVCNPSLQVYASFPDAQQAYYRHIIYKSESEGEVKYTSTVRSAACFLLLPIYKVCRPCREIGIRLKHKHQRAVVSESAPIQIHHPLNKISQERLNEAVTSLHKENIELRSQLEEFQRILDNSCEVIE